MMDPADDHHEDAADHTPQQQQQQATPKLQFHNTQQPPATTQRLGMLAGNVGSMLGNFATSSLQNLTTRKYTLPDKSVASQVLMYRQLLHTKCRPGLKLSRDYQATPAQKAVLHMPWWEAGIEESKKMVISYDNLIVRLWLNGAIMPYALGDAIDKASIETFIDEKGLPPVPHEYWVDRLGFQQPDPVTDFRSGGVLSLAMMVHIVESCPRVHERFVRPHGDASVLPFGITCINVTDMIAKFCMLAKSTDRMECLLSQKPFWRMFADPSSILALQELSLQMLANVVVELGEERKIPGYVPDDAANNHSLHGHEDGKVTVFDFSIILERTEKRVRDDLLGSGPRSLEELRAIEARLRVKYQNQLDRKKQLATQQMVRQQEALQRQQEQADTAVDSNGENSMGVNALHENSRKVADQVLARASTVASGATTLAAGVIAKVKLPGFNPLRNTEDEADGPAPVPQQPPDLLSANSDDGGWTPTEAVANFNLDEDEDDDML